jgi:pyruvate,water dikinase
LDELLDGLAANPDWVQTRIQTAQLLDVRRRMIRRLAEEASDLLERRERTKTAVLRIGGAVRRLHLEMGRRLVEGGILEEPADVELLGEAELVGAFSERATGRPRTSPGPSAPSAAPAAPVVPSMAVLASRRRWLARCEREGPLPEAFEGRPEHSPAPQLQGDRFQGWAASPGQMTGRARVLHRSTDPGLRRGDVLVAASTDASWAPLFMAAGAVIVEGGGPLSHAAILARELGIPAVVNLPGIVSRLEHEDRFVAVDGDEGRVTVLDRSGDGAADVGAAHDESADR